MQSSPKLFLHRQFGGTNTGYGGSYTCTGISCTRICGTGTGTDSTDIGTQGTGNNDNARLVCTIP